jgi:hypothetical protein
MKFHGPNERLSKNLREKRKELKNLKGLEIQRY